MPQSRIIFVASALPAYAKLALLLMGTLGVCFELFEGIMRLNSIRPIFGMKLKLT